MNNYQILGVRPDASHADVVRASRRMARLTHPDNPDVTNDEAFLVSRSAAEVLTDAKARKGYDMLLAAGNVPAVPAPLPARPMSPRVAMVSAAYAPARPLAPATFVRYF